MKRIGGKSTAYRDYAQDASAEITKILGSDGISTPTLCVARPVRVIYTKCSSSGS